MRNDPYEPYKKLDGLWYFDEFRGFAFGPYLDEERCQQEATKSKELYDDGYYEQGA